MNLIDIILVSLFVGLFLYIAYRFYKRIVIFFSDNLSDILILLERKNLRIVELRKPKKEEWKHNPFKSRDSFLLIDVFLPFSLISHRVLIAINKNNKKFIFWIRSTSPWFSRHKIEIKEDNSKTAKKKLKENLDSNIKIVKELCPACNTKLSESDLKCPYCGLHFE